MIMRNRPSDIADSKNVLELYAQEDPKQGENYIYIGRGGVDSEQTRNVNYIEITADTSTNKKVRSAANGQVSLRISVDKENQNNTIIGLASGQSLQDNGTGIRAFIGGQGDGSSNDIGGVQAAYYENGAVKYALVLDKDGIQLLGVPSSSSGLSSGGVYRDGTTLKIVS
jgi:hypothetical protein